MRKKTKFPYQGSPENLKEYLNTKPACKLPKSFGELENPKKIRVFESGASRNNADNKLDYHKFNSPLVEWGFAQYMHKHRFLEDGTMREGDNWQKGFDNDTILASLRRHIMDLELLEKGLKVTENGKEVSLLDTLYAIRFNTNARILKELEGLKEVERNFKE